jgi:hypothetical protein
MGETKYSLTSDFQDDLEKLINRYCVENDSDTPDFVLAQYMHDCLLAFNKASRRREQWFGKGLRILGGVVQIDPDTGKQLTHLCRNETPTAFGLTT